uniref:Uncharacterized protein n=1 Tax=Anguilla anguilla TaxID=7936 RepID=A0A0E9S262_ANGAN
MFVDPARDHVCFLTGHIILLEVSF